jgi:hypothetical protein
MAFKESSRFRTVLKPALAGLGLLLSVSASAEIFHGVDFPGGEASFADSVISYDPAFGGGAVPSPGFQNPSEALGAPNFPEGVDPEYVSLGAGGRIVLRFTNNALTGSGNSNLDLWIFEIGPDVEDTFVDISKDGLTWFSVGAVTGSTRGVDIDAFGFSTSEFFSFVRLTDNIALDHERCDGRCGHRRSRCDFVRTASQHRAGARHAPTHYYRVRVGSFQAAEVGLRI